MTKNIQYLSSNIFYNFFAFILYGIFSIFLIFTLIVTTSTLSFANPTVTSSEKNSKEANDLLKKFDISAYHPEVFGLKDLVADIRLSNLDKELSNQLGQMKIDDLYFTIYWISSGKVDVEINGLPKGFIMVKDTLIRSVQSYIEFIVPKTFSDRAKNYTLKEFKDSKSNEKIFIGIDKTHLNMIHEIKIAFDESEKLTKLLMITPQGTEDAYYTWEKEKWSQNKWVLNNILLKSDYGIQSKIVNNEITYNSFSGIGLPIKVSITTELFSKNSSNTNKGKNTKETSKDSTSNANNTTKGTENSSTIDSIYKIQRDLIISNYRINSGEANKYFLKKM